MAYEFRRHTAEVSQSVAESNQAAEKASDNLANTRHRPNNQTAFGYSQSFIKGVKYYLPSQPQNLLSFNCALNSHQS